MYVKGVLQSQGMNGILYTNFPKSKTKRGKFDFALCIFAL